MTSSQELIFLLSSQFLNPLHSSYDVTFRKSQFLPNFVKPGLTVQLFTVKYRLLKINFEICQHAYSFDFAGVHCANSKFCRCTKLTSSRPFLKFTRVQVTEKTYSVLECFTFDVFFFEISFGVNDAICKFLQKYWLVTSPFRKVKFEC